jgi:hypothetical protein
MTNDAWKKRLTRDMVIDLIDRLSGAALHSHRMIAEHSGLNKRRQPKVSGLVRFPMLEQAFEEVCGQHGGLLIGPVIDGTDWKIYQPFSRFGPVGEGMVIGLASIPEPGKLPTPNLSRKSGVKLNYFLTPRLDLDGTGPRGNDVFVLVLVCRDRAKAGRLQVMAVGVIDAEFNEFLHYETLEEFMASQTDTVEESQNVDPEPRRPSLKKNIVRFIPPEEKPTEEEQPG